MIFQAKLDDSNGGNNFLSGHNNHHHIQGHGETGNGIVNGSGGNSAVTVTNGGGASSNGQLSNGQHGAYLHPHANSQQQQQQQMHPQHSNNPPSRVVHIRGIPNDCTEGEVVALGLSFGRISNVLILKGKNQVRESECVAWLS